MNCVQECPCLARILFLFIISVWAAVGRAFSTAMWCLHLGPEQDTPIETLIWSFCDFLLPRIKNWKHKAGGRMEGVRTAWSLSQGARGDTLLAKFAEKRCGIYAERSPLPSLLSNSLLIQLRAEPPRGQCLLGCDFSSLADVG